MISIKKINFIIGLIFMLLYGNISLSMEHEDSMLVESHSLKIQIGQQTFDVQSNIIHNIPAINNLVKEQPEQNIIIVDALFPDPSALEENQTNFEIIITLLNPYEEGVPTTNITSFVNCLAKLEIKTNKKIQKYLNRLSQIEEIERKLQEGCEERERESEEMERKFLEERKKRDDETQKILDSLKKEEEEQSKQLEALKRTHQQKQEEIQRQLNECDKKIERAKSLQKKPSLIKFAQVIKNNFYGFVSYFSPIKQTITKHPWLTAGVVTATVLTGYASYKKWTKKPLLPFM